MKTKLILILFLLAAATIFPQTSSIVVEAPNGGENWKVGTPQTIKWNYSNVTNVKIEYSTDNGTNWILVAASVTAANKSYSWTVPNTPSPDCKVRISDAANPGTTDVSDNVFTIPNLLVTSPNGGEKWQSGTAHNITWSYNYISNVKIEYSTNNGSTWILVTSSYPASSLSYNWTVPGTSSAQCKIKISDASNPTVYDISDNTFTIADLALTSPNGYENWMINSSYPITWSSNNVGSVKVYLSTNDGTTWDYDITSQLTNQSANYAEWLVTDHPSSLCRMKICDASDAAIYDISDNAFSISKLILNSPNGGENLLSGQAYNITWTSSSNINNIKLEYTTNNGTNWITIANSISAASGSYTWTIPNLTSTQCKIRISNVAASQIYDLSNNNFSISKSINVTSPNGGEQWIIGTKHNITWSTSIPNVKIEYTTDNGTTWSLITSPISGATGTYQWTIPYTISSSCKVRISDISNLDNYDESDNVFSISNSAAITITSPSGGENWQAGTTQNITWNSDNVANVKIDYSTNNGVNWSTIVGSTTSDGSHLWLVPNSPSSQCKIKISDASNPAVFDESNIFTISYLKLSYPDGGENWLVDSSYTIKWNSSNVNSFKLFISRNNGIDWTEITSQLSNFTNTSAVWTVNNPASAQCKIKICDAVNPGIFDTSKNVFTVSTLKLISPNGGENWQSGTQKNITWRSNYTGNVIIEYSTDAGSTWSPAATVAGNSQSYAWTLPASLSNQYKVRFKDALNASLIYDQSDNNFTVSNIVVTAPNGTEKWYTGSTQSIKWTSSYIGNVKIQYSLNNGVDWLDIESSYPSAGIYSWTVPTTPSTQCRIRVISVDANCTTSDISDDVFTIAPTLKVTSPNGNENWQVGTKQNITWNVESTDNSISNVKIEYSTNSGSTWNVVAATVVATLGVYQWTIPNTPSSSCKIKVSNAAQSSSYDISDAGFTISTLAVISPNGGESWQVDSTKKIKWMSNYVSTVNLEYSINNGTSWNSIVSNLPAASGSYNWVVPNSPSLQCKIKVSNANNLENYDISDNIFTIAALKLTSPNGGEIYPVGLSKTITWSCTNVTNVKIEYSTNNGASWNVAAATTTGSTGVYSWTIPNTVSSQCKVKISDVTKPEVYDISDNTFTISNISVTAPNGGENWQSGTNQAITWNSSSDINNVKIEFSTNNGTSWSVAAASAPASAGSYNWTVPAAPSIQCKVRVSSASNSEVSDMSDNAFTIATLSLSSPNGGETYPVGQVKSISWTSSNVTNVKLEYSTNNGTSWNVIAATTPAAAGTYSWTIPNTISSQCKVKISDVAKPNVLDISDNTFNISTLSVTSPNGGETWQSGSYQNITWNSSSDINNVKIEYSTNSGTSWSAVISSTPASSGSYSWKVPGSSSALCKVKVSSIANPDFSDASDNTFIIASLSLTSPVGGENYQVGQSVSINWTSSNVANVKIEYSTNNGTSWNVIIASTPANSGTYNWVIPAAASAQCKIKISDASKPDINEICDNTFTILTKTGIQITSPNGNENWQTGSIKYITWLSDNVNMVRLEYSLNNGTGWNLIADSVTSTGTYEWLVPSYPTVQGKIRISDIKNLSVNDISDNVFTISSIELSYPGNIETFLVGSKQNITWTCKNIKDIKIEYSTDAGSSWNLITASTSASTGSYSWIVPNTPSLNCKLKISDASNPGIYTRGSSAFSIIPIALISPNGQESWKVNSVHKIIWDCSADIKKLKIEYSTDRGASWSTIASSLNASVKSYNWKIPDLPSENCLVKVSDTSNVYVVSKNYFTINNLTLSAPNGGEKWLSGSTQSISWSSKYISSISILYSIDNGAAWIPIKDSIPSTGIYNWTIPGISSVQCRIKICSTKDFSIEDISDSTFEIKDVSSVSDKLKDKPEDFTLLQNYPNPFNPATTIWYSVPELSHVEIKVYNSLGKEIASLVNEDKSTGNYHVVFSAKGGGISGNNIDLPSGVYFYRLQAVPVNNSSKVFIDTKKFILLK